MNKTILVTGADGFIGSHLVENLLKKGYKVNAFVYYNSFNSWGWLEPLSKKKIGNLSVYPGDIRDKNFVDNVVKKSDISLESLSDICFFSLLL